MMMAKASFRLGFLDHGAGNADADDEQHHDRNGCVGKAGDGDVQHLTVLLGLHDGVVSGHFVEVVDEFQAEGADNEAADGGKDTGNNRDGFTLARVAGEVGQPGPVGYVHDGIGHAVEDVHHGDVDHEGSFVRDTAGGEQQDEENGVHQCADDQPDAEFSEAGVGIVDDHAHHGVVDGVPDPGHAQQNTGKGRAESKGVGHVKHQKGADQIADRVLAHSTDAEGVLLTCRKPISLCCLGSHLSFLLQNLNFFRNARGPPPF